MGQSEYETVNKLCQQFGIKPRLTSGQNFLIDRSAARRIVDESGPLEDRTVLEIGPGLGVLTEPLSDVAKKVIAVELDKRTIEALSFRLGERKHLQLVRADIFQWWKDIGRHELKGKPYVAVSNLPFAVTSRVIREFLTTDPKPERMILMVQQEVARRLTARPGAMSKLSLSAQAYAEVEILFDVPRKLFWPKPNVDSSVIRFSSIKPFIPNEKQLFRIIRAGFGGRRKMLRNSLSSSLHQPPDIVTEWLEQHGIDPSARAQELSLEQWKTLAEGSFPAVKDGEKAEV